MLAWQRRPRATRTTARLEPAIHPHLHDRLRPAQPGVRHPHPLTLRRGFHASATLSRSGWSSNRPAPDSPSCFVLRASRPLLPKPPRPCCCHPSPSPPSRSPCPTARWPATRPHRRPGPDLRRPRRAHRVLRHRQRGAKHRFPLTTRSANPAPAVTSDELIAQHTTRPAAEGGHQPDRPPPAAGMPEEQAPALPLQQPRPNQTLICWRLRERPIGPGQGSWVKAASRQGFAEGRAGVLRAGPLGQVPGSWSRSAMITSRCCRCAGEPGGTAGRLFPLPDPDIAVILAGAPRPPADRSHRRCRGRPRTTSIDSITVSNEKGQSERSPSRRSARPVWVGWPVATAHWNGCSA